MAQLPLHGGSAPPWLFRRMVRLAGAVAVAIAEEHGPREMLRRLADPWWFQAFGCVLGFDWHSSGLTTVTCGALGEAARSYGDDMGLCVAGGKAGAGRKAPQQITEKADRLGLTEGPQLVTASRMSAKVDSAAVQDGHQVYHHSFFFVPDGAWCVVQQGIRESAGTARRYHWLGESTRDFVCEPHAGVQPLPSTSGTNIDNPHALLNMVAEEAGHNRARCTELVHENPDALAETAERYTLGPTLFAPAHHEVRRDDIDPQRLRRVVRAAHERAPQDFATLLGTPQVGPKAVRSLALLAELIYETPASRRDPAEPAAQGRQTPHWADHGFAHGGKDGHPFPVDTETYDQNIEVLTRAVRQARTGRREREQALRRVGRLSREA